MSAIHGELRRSRGAPFDFFSPCSPIVLHKAASFQRSRAILSLAPSPGLLKRIYAIDEREGDDGRCIMMEYKTPKGPIDLF